MRDPRLSFLSGLFGGAWAHETERIHWNRSPKMTRLFAWCVHCYAPSPSDLIIIYEQICEFLLCKVSLKDTRRDQERSYET